MTDTRKAELNDIIRGIDTAGDLMAVSTDPSYTDDDWSYITAHMFDAELN